MCGRLKDQVFVGKRPYEVGPLEMLLKKEFGEFTTMGCLPPAPKILVTGAVLVWRVHNHGVSATSTQDIILVTGAVLV